MTEEKEEMTESERARAFYPNMTKDAEGTQKGGLQPSMEGQGFESVEIFREQTPQEKKEGGMRYIDRMQIRELPRFLIDRFRSAAQLGTLPDTYDHHIAELERLDVFDAKTLKVLKDYSAEVRKANTYKKQLEILDPLFEYIGQLKMGKRG